MTEVEDITCHVIDLRKQKKFKEAEAILISAIVTNSHAWQLWNQLGHILVAYENYSQAASAFETATKLNPNGFWLWLSLGSVQIKLSQIESAIDTTLESTKLTTNPNEIGSALYNLACYNCVAGRHEEAIDYLDRAINNDASIKAWARVDVDFESLKNNERFLRLLEFD